MKKINYLLNFTILIFLLFSCSSDDNNNIKDENVASIEIIGTPNNYILGKDAVVPNVVAKNAAGEVIENVDIEWSSSNETILSVDSNINIFSKSIGQTELIASHQNISDSLPVIVSAPSDEGDFTFFSSDGVDLRASINLPSGNGPFPAVVFTHGSGNGPGASRPTLQGFADVFTNNGIAVFFYDKRGVGESGGVYDPDSAPVLWLFHLGDDAIAALEFMRQHEKINSDQVGYYGVSQGGWINPMATAQIENVAFMVNVVGPVCSLGEELFYSSLIESGMSIEDANAEVYNYTGIHGYDPVFDLEEIEEPGLWVLGGQDESIPTQVTLDRLDILISSGKPYDINYFPNANHGLVDVTTGQQNAWITPEGGVIDWIMSKIN